MPFLQRRSIWDFMKIYCRTTMPSSLPVEQHKILPVVPRYDCCHNFMLGQLCWIGMLTTIIP